VAGLEDGTVPAARARGPAALEEERRLLHVALSRATRHLGCSRCASRVHAGRDGPREASPFLAEVEAACSRLADAARSCPPPPRLARPQGEPPTTPDPVAVRLDALLAWRDRWARALQVPAAAVLADATARHVAGQAPTTVDELAAVPGIGPARAARLGPSLLAVVAASD
jgi:DNA helicase-2/ATP-dependent DNA helicase PcrA